MGTARLSRRPTYLRYCSFSIVILSVSEESRVFCLHDYEILRLVPQDNVTKQAAYVQVYNLAGTRLHHTALTSGQLLQQPARTCDRIPDLQFFLH